MRLEKAAQTELTPEHIWSLTSKVHSSRARQIAISWYVGTNLGSVNEGILHELEGDFPCYQSRTKKMYYEMVKDMDLQQVSY